MRPSDAVARMLADRSDLTVTNVRVPHGLLDSSIVGFLHNQNPESPARSLRLVSVNRGEAT